MIRRLTLLATLPLLAAPACGQEAPSPTAIVADAPTGEWVAIAPDDLLVMDLAPDRDGQARRVVIQLIPPPFSQGWVDNIRTLVRARWWDGTSVNRVQDNYVAQWGDATEAKPLPAGLEAMEEGDYELPYQPGMFQRRWDRNGMVAAEQKTNMISHASRSWRGYADPYAPAYSFAAGLPIALWTDVETVEADPKVEGSTGHWLDRPYAMHPVHCYATVGVGRNLSPDTGTGAELYAVIGHAPRHLDRNIAVVGRVVEGIEHLSSLPRGKGELGFYDDPAKRVPIASVRLASDLPAAQRPRFEYMNTEGEAFARYAEARANRRDPFFIMPAGGADICNIPVPIRRVEG